MAQKLKTSLKIFKYSLLIVAMCLVVGCEKDDYDPNSYFDRFANLLFYKISFGNYGSEVFCTNDLTIKFNRPINSGDAELSEMFYISTGTERIPVDIHLSEDGLLVKIVPQNDLPPGQYWLGMDFVDYTAQIHYNNSYLFWINEELVVKFTSNIDPNYRDSQYGSYSTFYMGDTVYFTPSVYEGKNFVGWDLPGIAGINYTNIGNGTLKIIFDCENYFYNNNIKDGSITITAKYK